MTTISGAFASITLYRLESDDLVPLSPRDRQYYFSRADAVFRLPVPAIHGLRHSATYLDHHPAVVNNIRAGFTPQFHIQWKRGRAARARPAAARYSQYARSNGDHGCRLYRLCGFGNRPEIWATSITVTNSMTVIYWTRGKHSMQFGTSLRYRRTWQQNANASALGNLAFQAQFTAQLTVTRKVSSCRKLVVVIPSPISCSGLPATGQVVGLPLLPYRFTQVNPYLKTPGRSPKTLH